MRRLDGTAKESQEVICIRNDCQAEHVRSPPFTLHKVKPFDQGLDVTGAVVASILKTRKGRLVKARY